MTTPVSCGEREQLLTAKVSVPRHVVYRAFVGETVVLNLNSGRYHGLNPTGGRMLEALERAATVAAAADVLSTEYAQPRDQVEADLCRLCSDLFSRGLIEISSDGDR